jgi:hypothetical protein
VPNITTVLCTIVDYKGVRYVGQSIIPGILTQGENSARLLYGILETNRLLTVKHDSLQIMRNIAQKLSLSEKMVSPYPFGMQPVKVGSEEEEAKASRVVDDPLTKLLQSAETNQVGVFPRARGGWSGVEWVDSFWSCPSRLAAG